MRAFLALAAILALGMPAAGSHCATSSTSAPELDSDPAGIGLAPRYYVDNDLSQTDGPLFSIWVYEESNGIPGLQRGDEIVDDTCHGLIQSDTILL